ncbi:hypothetical protein GCM10014715_84170 [Streptomyces spiralis]|uniref:Uncharacterized protein n=1 Tax=Streptomyces spiralis TaxID=66376 RepID=A0A919E5I5_9ACTN|nr:hypothetical protein GCM10014715_84170 [Streptomyces spiralis]
MRGAGAGVRAAGREGPATGAAWSGRVSSGAPRRERGRVVVVVGVVVVGVRWAVGAACAGRGAARNPADGETGAPACDAGVAGTDEGVRRVGGFAGPGSAERAGRPGTFGRVDGCRWAGAPGWTGEVVRIAGAGWAGAAEPVVGVVRDGVMRWTALPGPESGAACAAGWPAGCPSGFGWGAGDW